MLAGSQRGFDLIDIQDMTALLAVMTPIALLNSVSILPTGISGVAASLGAPKPFPTASAFIAGNFVPMFTLGLLVTLGLDAAFQQLGFWARDVWQDPDALVVLLQLIIGAVMIAFGYRLSRASPHRPDRASTTRMTLIRAFSVAAGVTLIGLPSALLYFAAIDQILRAELTVVGMAKAVLFYNVIVLLPLVSIVLFCGLLGKRSDQLFGAVARFFERWGRRLLFFGMLGVGAVLTADATGWFLGHPLIPSYGR